MYTLIYASKTPAILSELINTPEIQRLSDVGMHCGCEYADFPIYRQERSRYTRLVHSIGVANIVWNFTGDIKQAVAGLLHDIATPVFAHTIDFLNNDHIAQESTEENTLLFIERSKSIRLLLDKYSIRIEDIFDYHKYPIADNDTPMLSADRLEYTLGNGYLVYNMDLCEIQDIYNDLIVVKNENEADELCFASIGLAKRFVEISLRNSRLFVSDEDRFSMQYLADTIRYALRANVLSPEDLFTTESNVIQKLKSDAKAFELWDKYTKISAVETVETVETVEAVEVSGVTEMVEAIKATEAVKTIEVTEAADNVNPKPKQYCVNVSAKRRYINPLVVVKGGPKRISEVDFDVSREIEEFLALDFDRWICAK